jgi:UvrD-like helicase C-terminal domain/AAA domain
VTVSMRSGNTRKSLIEDLMRGLVDAATAGVVAVPADGADRPDLIVLDPERGVLAVEIEPEGADPSDTSPFVRLNRKLAEMQESVPMPSAGRPTRIAVFGGIESGADVLALGGRVVLGRNDVTGVGWLSRIPAAPADSMELAELRAALTPELVFTTLSRRGARDDGAGQREQLRVQLDAEQSAIATRTVQDTLVLGGPPGSGKSLVLAARARWLASRHPHWRIQLLCFNRALVPYLRSLVSGHANVHVETFGKYAHSLGIRVWFDDDTRTAEALAVAKRRGLDWMTDALLIDEVQDFHPVWLKVALAVLRPHGGGAVLAGDPAQALYHDSDLATALAEHHVERLQLDRPYRSTGQILRATVALDPSFSIEGIPGAPSGEPVDLIWAQRWDDQAACVAWEIRQMLDSGLRQPQDIGALVTTKYGTFKRLSAALAAKSVPFLVINESNINTFDPLSPSVKIITVHSAKGHEFPVVVLFGLEALPDPDPEDVEATRRGRVGFVGATRAKDRLIVTYSKDNQYLGRLGALSKDVRRWVWPDDYEL